MKYNTKNINFLILLFVIFTACSPSIDSRDFTPEGSFTSGIEGPATDAQGHIYAVNYDTQGTIGTVTPNGEHTLFVSLPNGSIGNGIRFGKQQQMFVADYTNHNILEIDMAQKSIDVFAHNPNANQPNDITIAPNQTLYASDPNWANNTGNLWKVTKAKGFELLEANMGTTNGIEVSPDGKKLYVNESVQRQIWVYDINEDGTIANKQQFMAFNDYGLDGMRFDNSGNLYVCRHGKGTVAVLSPTGAVLRELQLKGKQPTNITFSNDYSKCYITVADRGCIEVIDL